MDCSKGTVYTYTMPSVWSSGRGSNIGIVSFKNVPANSPRQHGMTVTLITTQGAAHGGGTGYANTVATNGIGVTCSINPVSFGSSVAGISTRARCSAGSTVTLSSPAGDSDFVSFFIHYLGGTNTDLNQYKVYVSKNGGFNQGGHGV